MIEDFFIEPFHIYKKTETKVKGVVNRTYSPISNEVIEDPPVDPPNTVPVVFYGGLFTPSQIKTVVAGKQEILVSKNLYCPVSTPLEFGDFIRMVDTGKEYDVIIEPENTAKKDHHLLILLATRIG